MKTWNDIDKMVYEMLRDGYEPAGIVGSPVQLKRLVAELPANELAQPSTSGGGYQYKGLPIFRSHEVSGPCVVSRDVLRAMRGWERAEPVGLTSYIGDPYKIAEKTRTNTVLF